MGRHLVAVLLAFSGCGPGCGSGSAGGGSALDGSSADVAVPRARPDLVRFAVIGDYGVDSIEEAQVAALVRGWNPDFIVTTGDNNYGSGEASTIDDNVGRHYAAFIGAYRGAHGPGSAENRFWPSPGNHDWETAYMGPYIQYFTLPGNERYYEVDFGLVHLFVLDTDPREPDGVTAQSAQAAWLKSRLAASVSCFDVVAFHHAAFSSGRHGSVHESRWPFGAWGADVVLAGHDHTYERLQVDGIPYFVNGLGGAPLYEFHGTIPESQFRYADRHGAMLVTATRTEITYELWNVEGNKIDRHVVPKACPARPRHRTD